MTRYKNCCIARKPIVNLITAFKVEVKVSQSYANENGGKTGGKVGGDVPSLSQALSLVLSPVCPKLREVQLKKIVSVIDYLFRASGSITELMDCAGEKNKSRFRKTILKPLVDTSLVEPTIKGMPRARRIFIFHKENEANVEKDIYEIMDMLRFGFGRWNEMMTYPFPFKFLQEYLDDASEIAFSKHWSEITAKGQI